MSEIKLKSCPFCGGKAESLTPWAGTVCGYWVRCEACGCETAVYSTKEQAEKVWNRRTGEQNETD